MGSVPYTLRYNVTPHLNENRYIQTEQINLKNHTFMEILDRITPQIHRVIKRNRKLRDLALPIWQLLQKVTLWWHSLLNPNKFIPPPTSICESLNDWVNTYSTQNQKKLPEYKVIYPQHTITRLLPKTIDENVHWQYQRNLQYQLPDAFVATIPDGRVWNDGYIITPDNILLKEFTTKYSFDSIKTSLPSLDKLPPLHKLSGSLAVLSCDYGTGYYHWMFEVIPRLALLEKAGFKIQDIDYFLVNQHASRFQIDTLKDLGIQRHKIIESCWYPHIQAEQIIAPSLVGVPVQVPGWACDFLRHNFIDNKVAKNRQPLRIYLNRSQVVHRKVENEGEIIEFLSRFGFCNIATENLSIWEQAELLSSAEIVIAPHGAGLTNLVFCKPGTKVIELLSPKGVSTLFWALGNHVGLDYYYLLGEGEGLPEETYYHVLSENISINLHSLDKLLQLAGIK
ncbi:DUF563 domain-containing protein [Calothrix sp. PCC 7507]|uniref:glycosyltransferase family 61 protein n=1 Tax=Calothrix sp. PCC 7507 TaxID=99598 RepID=UPI00029EEC53|nr:glycosyltransferase family 61 protein [Calothrix sp. PCC 7507]AFY36227.1 hypothetical protein Cal7507_5914 [Calothrix sp. PCC 7507]